MIPEKLNMFYNQLIEIIEKTTKIKIMNDICDIPQDRLEEISSNIDGLNGRLDNLVSVMGKMLEIQMSEINRRYEK